VALPSFIVLFIVLESQTPYTQPIPLREDFSVSSRGPATPAFFPPTIGSFGGANHRAGMQHVYLCEERISSMQNKLNHPME
jgi:hypothetical protein